VLSSFHVWCRGQDAASEARYCRSTNVAGNYFMTKCAQLFCGLLIIVSCTPTKTDETGWFETDWIFVRDSSNYFNFDPRYIGLRFRNDTLITISDLWLTHEGRYSVNGNQIQVFDEDTTDFEIIKLTKDSLILFGYTDTLKYYNRTLEFDQELRFQKITLQGGQCFGECPEFYLTMDDKGNAEFKGLENSKFQGTKIYSIEFQAKNRIDSLFKWSNINNIDTTDFYGSDDDWSLTISFQYGDNELKRIRGTHSSMPLRLKGIIRTLLDDLRKRGLV
jgi:hypothetical protein